MKLVLSLALRNLLRNPRRTAISLAAVGFGVAAVIIAGGFVDSLLIKLREDTIYSQLGHIQIQDSKFATRGLSEPYAHLLPEDGANLESIARLPGVRVVTPRLSLSGLIAAGETTLSFSGHAIDAAKEALLGRGLAIVDGTPLGGEDQDGVVLGERLAANLGVKPGDKVAILVNTANGTLNGSDLVVRGTFTSPSKLYDETGLRMPLMAAQRLLRVKGAHQWLVFLDDTEAIGTALDRIRSLLPAAQYSIARWDEDADFYNKTVELFGRQFGFVRLVVAAIILLSILNTMTMNVLERTWEIGVMLALGDPRRQVLALFASEGALLAVVGSFLGVLIGLVLAAALNAVGISMPAPPGMSHGFDAGITLSSRLVLIAAVIGVAAATVAALPPALRASRIPVVNALRHSH